MLRDGLVCIWTLALPTSFAGVLATLQAGEQSERKYCRGELHGVVGLTFIKIIRFYWPGCIWILDLPTIIADLKLGWVGQGGYLVILGS